MCLYTRYIQNRKYVSNKKNGGKVPTPQDKRVLLVPVGCGKCMECRKQKAREWRVRLSEEIRKDKNGKFVTLTFDEKQLSKLTEEVKEEYKGMDNEYLINNEVATIAVRRFLERWRKKYKKSVKHWLITELGQKKTERIHLHGIIFTSEKNEVIEEKWMYGNVYIGEYVNEKTIGYITKYLSKTDEKHKEYKGIVLTSPGIGKGYMERKDWENNKYRIGKTEEVYITRNGLKLAMPIYLRNKIYTEDEREKLWLEKLDKQIRYINGVKIDVSKGDEIYFKRLAVEREKNKRLGYGGDETNWDEAKYKKQRAQLRNERKTKKRSNGVDNG